MQNSLRRIQTDNRIWRRQSSEDEIANKWIQRNEGWSENVITLLWCKCSCLKGFKWMGQSINDEITLSSHTCSSKKTNNAIQPANNLFWNVHSESECLFLFWSAWILPLPNGILTPGLPFGRKQHIAAMETMPGQWLQILPDLQSLSVHLKSYIIRGILKRGLINSSIYSVRLITFQCQLRSFLLCVLNLATHVRVESDEEGAGETLLSKIMNFDCQTHFNC